MVGLKSKLESSPLWFCPSTQMPWPDNCGNDEESDNGNNDISALSYVMNYDALVVSISYLISLKPLLFENIAHGDWWVF